MAKAKTILLVVSGSIAAYRACDVISALKKEGHKVLVIMTKSAEEFITPLTLKSISGEPVYRDPFEHPQINLPVHTSLADQADLIAFVPASANLIARLSHGLADDLATCVALASKAKKFVVPAMNDNMYSNPLTQENLNRLKKAGFSILEPIEGHLVCERVGKGHIPSTEDILKTIRNLLK